MDHQRADVLTPREVARLLMDDASARLGMDAGEVTLIEPLWCTVRYDVPWGSIVRDADMRDGVLHDLLTVTLDRDDPTQIAWLRTALDATYLSDDPRWQQAPSSPGADGKSAGALTDWTEAGVMDAIARATEVTARVLKALGLAG